MKKNILALILLITSSVYCQKVILTETEIRLDNDTGHIDIALPGRTNDEMLKALTNYAIETGVIKEKKENFIQFKNVAKKAVGAKSMGRIYNFDIEYMVLVLLKDGKARIAFAGLEFIPNGHNYKLCLSCSAFDGMPIFDKKGKVKREEEKAAIEKHFNEKIEEIKTVLSGEKPNKVVEEW